MDDPTVVTVADTSGAPAVTDDGNTMTIKENVSSTDNVSSKTDDKPGQAKIKKEFLLLNYKPKLMSEYVSSEMKGRLQEQEAAQKRKNENVSETGGKTNEPPNKKIKFKGRNKKRPVTHIQAKDKLCPTVFQEKDCRFGEKCKFSHDVVSFMKTKPKDLGLECFLYQTYGRCPYGVACRFAGSHITEDFKNVVNTELYEAKSKEKSVTNILEKEVQVLLWKKKYNFDKANQNVKKIQQMAAERLKTFASTCNNKQEVKQTAVNGVEKDGTAVENKVTLNTKSEQESTESNIQVSKGDNTGEQTVTAADHVTASKCEESGGVDVIRLRPQEKKKINFENKTYLAPLTTVGNLPFRRICKNYGADITCGEMALATNILNGQMSEWALLKRHTSEDLFGIQICGGWADSLSRCAQLINENLDIDFVDLNCGCPIDLVYKKGEGCALMGKTNKMEQIIKGMKSVLDIPLTVKMRTGIFDHKSVAHNIIPKLRDWGVSMVTLHGRSREQRYTHHADWNYINLCAEAAAPMPLFGNGDILSYEDLHQHLENTKISGCMIARGALIKPWIFTEIKERRHWDISAQERFDMLKQFVNNGLEHWGSDQQGVETTRRFLLEWLSFMHRYIPIGILERVPQKINERPPYYVARNDLETLLSSPNCGDWVKISEMLLGTVPDGFSFLPKHKANAYK